MRKRTSRRSRETVALQGPEKILPRRAALTLRRAGSRTTPSSKLPCTSSVRSFFIRAERAAARLLQANLRALHQRHAGLENLHRLTLLAVLERVRAAVLEVVRVAHRVEVVVRTRRSRTRVLLNQGALRGERRLRALTRGTRTCRSPLRALAVLLLGDLGLEARHEVVRRGELRLHQRFRLGGDRSRVLLVALRNAAPFARVAAALRDLFGAEKSVRENEVCDHGHHWGRFRLCVYPALIADLE